MSAWDQAEPDGELWEVKRDGKDTTTFITLACADDQRGRVALTFAVNDDAGWDFRGEYNELLWVRRCRPNPEQEPGQAIRVHVSRDRASEWDDDDNEESDA